MMTYETGEQILRNDIVMAPAPKTNEMTRVKVSMIDRRFGLVYVEWPDGSDEAMEPSAVKFIERSY